MLFKFIEKPITLDCFTADANAFYHAPIVPSTKALPTWLKGVGKDVPKNDPRYVNKPLRTTLKQCNGFIDYFSQSFTLPLWSDLHMYVSEEGSNEWSYEYADQKSEIHIHAPYERGDFLPEENYQHFKLVSPWAIATKNSFQVHVTSPMWQLPKPEQLLVLPAVIDFKYAHGTHVNMMIPKQQEAQSILLQVGQPLMNLVPLTDKKINVKCHLVDDKEIDRIHSHLGTGFFSHRINRHKKNPLACPFNRDKTR